MKASSQPTSGLERAECTSQPSACCCARSTRPAPAASLCFLLPVTCSAAEYWSHTERVLTSFSSLTAALWALHSTRLPLHSFCCSQRGSKLSSSPPRESDTSNADHPPALSDLTDHLYCHSSVWPFYYPTQKWGRSCSVWKGLTVQMICYNQELLERCSTREQETPLRIARSTKMSADPRSVRSFSFCSWFQ